MTTEQNATQAQDTHSLISNAMESLGDNTETPSTDQPHSQDAQAPAQSTQPDAGQPQNTDTNHQTPTPEDSQVSPSPDDPNIDSLVSLLSQNGFENITSENAQSRLVEALSDRDSLMGQADQVSQLQQSIFDMQQQIESGRHPASQAQSQDNVGQDAFAIPSFRQDWNHYLDSETGIVNDTAPVEVKEAFRKISEYRQKQISDPVGWLMDGLQAASSDPRFSQLIAPAIQPVIEAQFGQREVQQQADQQYTELQNEIFQKDPVTQKIRMESGQPIYNDKGNQIYNAAIEELSFHRNIHPSQVASMVSEQELIGVMHRQMKRAGQTSQQSTGQQTPQNPQNTQLQPQSPNVEDQRQQNRNDLISQNSFNTMQDPGGDRSGNAFSDGRGTANLESSNSPQAIAAKGPRSLLQAAMLAQSNGQ